ncbi:MAG: RluA family pseudouridine synthase [Solobacterium sp.]|nr:RluA family pseudouridine synthase [Solobacterium sp.]
MIKKIVMTVTAAEAGRSIGSVLRTEYGLSRKEISRLKFTQGIFVNDEQKRVSTVLHEADVLTLVFREKEGEVPAYSGYVPVILYEDEDMVIAEKPAGMPCHRSHGHLDDDLGTALQSYYADQLLTVRPVGRLDKDVSGIMVYAKNTAAAARLNRQRQDGILQKTYTAIAQGHFEEGEGTLRFSLHKEAGNFARQTGGAGKECVTEYRTVKNGQELSLLEVRILTGRTHQIRAGFASVSHPLAGDKLYGGSTDRIGRPALHCSKITLCSPFTKKKISVSSDLPEDMRSLFDIEQ